jgi:ATP-dependent DNA ligase
VRLLTRRGHDWTDRFSLIAQAAGALKARSFPLDGEAIACGQDGLPSFDRLRYRRGDGSVFLFVFDLLELNGQDLRRELLEGRKATLWPGLARACGSMSTWSTMTGTSSSATPASLASRASSARGSARAIGLGGRPTG